MTYDLGFGLLLLGMIALGTWRGAVASGSGLLSLAAAYGGALLGALHAAGWVERSLVVSPSVAPAIAGTLGFVLVWLVSSTAGDLLVAWDARRVDESGRSVADRCLGGFFGLARGSLLVLLISALVNWLDAARDFGAMPALASLPEPESSALGEASTAIVSTTLSVALDGAGPVAGFAGRVAANPKETIAATQSVLEDERMVALVSDAYFWTLVQNGSIDAAMNRGTFRALVGDAALRERIVDLGWVSEEAREDPRVFSASLESALRKTSGPIARLDQDAELQALAEDPEILRMIEGGDVLGLIAHPGVQAILDRLTDGS